MQKNKSKIATTTHSLSSNVDSDAGRDSNFYLTFANSNSTGFFGAVCQKLPVRRKRVTLLLLLLLLLLQQQQLVAGAATSRQLHLQFESVICN